MEASDLTRRSLNGVVSEETNPMHTGMMADMHDLTAAECFLAAEAWSAATFGHCEETVASGLAH